VIQQQPGPVSSTHTALGVYEVDFSKDVSGCAYVATPGGAGTNPPPSGEVNVAGATTAGDVGVVVQTYNNTGATADASFHLVVSCP
jgi:hypothetical protein